MTSSPTHLTTVALTEKNPSYGELVDLYNLLRTSPGSTPTEDVAQYALAQVVGEFIDYLDFVEAEFEKSIGLNSSRERERILREFRPPGKDVPLENVAAIVNQWRGIERYSYEDIFESLQEEKRHLRN
jgi:hypothetical protein